MYPFHSILIEVIKYPTQNVMCKDEMKKTSINFETRKIIYILTAVAFGLQLLVFFKYGVNYSGDAKVVLDSAQNQLDGGLNYYEIIYFLNNPNNLGMLYIDMVFLKIGGLFGISGKMLLSVVGMLLAAVATALLSLIIHETLNNKVITYIGFAISVFMVTFNPWCAVPYTDVFSVCIPLGALYLYIKNKKLGKTGLRRMIFPLLITVVGLCIKPTNIFTMVAIVLIELFSYRSESKKKSLIIQWVLTLVISFVVYTILIHAMQYGVGFKKNEAYEKPWTHYAMMGLNTEKYGRYNARDDEYTNSFASKKAKEEANIQEIENRLDDMGLEGYVEFGSKKIYGAYKDGTYAWGIWTEGDGNLPMKRIRDIVWGWVLIFAKIEMIYLVVRGKKISDKTTDVSGVMICLMYGAYLLIFEIGARYLYMYSPIYILTGVLGAYRVIYKEGKNVLARLQKK